MSVERASVSFKPGQLSWLDKKKCDKYDAERSVIIRLFLYAWKNHPNTPISWLDDVLAHQESLERALLEIEAEEKGFSIEVKAKATEEEVDA